MTQQIEYRTLETIHQLHEASELEEQIWQLPALATCGAHILRAITFNGGVAIGAFDGEHMVGITIGFPARKNGRVILWSQLAGVLPQYQKRGIGLGLKREQRVWALANDYDEIRWTFDPLLRGNANFNMKLLGTTVSTYHVDYYGIMPDEVNPPVPSDRLEATWKLNDPRVVALANGDHVNPVVEEFASERNLIHWRGDRPPETTPIPDEGSGYYFMQIPRDLAAVQAQGLDLLMAWRLAVRETLQNAFDQGYTIVDMLSVDDHTFSYVLHAPKPYYLYVLRCTDDSLYTGIATDVKRRVSEHNNGKGAAYTRSRRPVTPLASWRFPNQSAALKAEAAFKRLNRAAKLNHAENQQSYRNSPYIKPEID